MANDAPVKSGLLGLQVAGYGQHDYSTELQVTCSSRQRLLGLEWRLEMRLTAGNRDGLFRWSWRVRLRCSDVDHSSSQVVYPARLRLRVILPNGQVITDVQDPVKLRFHGSTYATYSFHIDHVDVNGEHPEFQQFIGPPNHPLLESFMLLAQIDVMGQPTVLKPAVYEHSAKFFDRNFDANVDQRTDFILAGYRRAHKRLIVWRTCCRRLQANEEESTISCFSLHPLIPRSVQELCTTTRMRNIGGFDFFPLCTAAALSTEGRLSAYICNDYFEGFEPDDELNIDLPKTCDLFVFDMVAGELTHRRYDIPQNSASGIVGLAHTQRGWVAWSRRWFWRLAEQMEVLVGNETTSWTALATHRHLYSYVDNEGQRNLFRWDLSEKKLARKSFDTSSSGESRESREFVVDDEERLFAVDVGPDALCVSRVILEADRCLLEPIGIYGHDIYLSIILDWPRVILVNEISDYPTTQTIHWTTRVYWRTTPAAKELALLSLQKNNGRMIRPAPNNSSPHQGFWTGGMTEEELKDILETYYSDSRISVKFMT